MNYKLYPNSLNDPNQVEATIFLNRGIKDYKHYINLTSKDLIPYSLLDNIDDAVKILIKHINENHKIGVLVDEDPDGYCSAAMMILYLKDLQQEEGYDFSVQYILHTKAKDHGLSELTVIPDDINLLIIPDAGTNDVEQCKYYHDKKNMDIIILDHHESEKNNPYATIVNNQISTKYENKELSGGGIVYKFLIALDNELWCDFANKHIDLCALANISDDMNIKSYETKYIINQGLHNIISPIFQELIKVQAYYIPDITIHNIQWYITPILNGMIRIGSNEDKELVFRAFIEDYDEFVLVNRKTKKEVLETIYQRAARLCKNAKSRQDKQREKSVNNLISYINDNEEIINDKVIVIDATNMIEDALSGITAIKIAEKYLKPCILIKRYTKNNTVLFGGSARNFNNSPISNLKDIVNATGLIECAGHQNAFGILSINDSVQNIRTKLNHVLKDVIYDKTVLVDFIINSYDFNFNIVHDIALLQDYIGKGFDEIRLVIKEVTLFHDDLKCYINQTNENITVTFDVNENHCVQFKCDKEHPLYKFYQENEFNDMESITFDMLGKINLSYYQGMKSYQFFIDELLVVKKTT